MTLERIEKLLPLSLIAVCLVAIILRIGGVIPHIVATDEFEISRTIFIDAGIGGLLAVFAIVISLTLMGIQFASQEYTHRVMNTYLSSVMLWSMMGSYIITVLYNLYMTAFLKLPVDSIYADISVILQTLCLVLLVPHFVIAVFHLKPEYTINRVLNSVSVNYLEMIKNYLTSEKTRLPHKIDKLLPAVEILEKSIERGDRATVRVGLEDIQASYTRFVNNENETWLAGYFLDYFLRLGREAVIESDDDSIAQVLEIFGNIGYMSENAVVVNVVINNIRTIGSAALKKEFDTAVEQMIDSLQQISVKTSSDEIAERIFHSMSEIGTQLFSMDKKLLILYMVKRLSETAPTFIESKDFSTLKKWSTVVEEIGKMAVAHDARDVVRSVIQALYLSGMNVTKLTADGCDTTDICDAIVETLVRIERQLPKTDRELYGEINFAKQEIEQNLKRCTVEETKPSGIETSDLW